MLTIVGLAIASCEAENALIKGINTRAQMEKPCDSAPIVETWTKAQYDAFGVDYKGSAKIEIAPGVTLEKTKANDHELVFNDAAAGAITLAVKNGNVYQAFTFNTQCADNYIFDGKNVSGIKYGAMEEPEDVTITCTQAYYPSAEVNVWYLSNNRDNINNTNYNGLVANLTSYIWTHQGTPMIRRFYLNFDLSDYEKTVDVSIKNTDLYLYHDTWEGNRSNIPNQHEFHCVISDWDKTIITWNNQPNFDITTSILTDHISGTLNDPDKTTDYIFNLNAILLKNGKLRADYNGIICKPYEEDVNDYYRGMAFSNTISGNEALIPMLKVKYAISLPKIKLENNVFSVTNNEDLEALFKDVKYIWTIDGEEKMGKSVSFGSIANYYTVNLQIIITNNIGEIYEYSTSKTF